MIAGMRPLILLCAAALCLVAADKKKPVVTTKTTVQVGGAPKTAARSGFSTGFNALDRNNDGYITRQEFGYNRNSAQAGPEFDRMDTNKDGRISRSEYK